MPSSDPDLNAYARYQQRKAQACDDLLAAARAVLWMWDNSSYALETDTKRWAALRVAIDRIEREEE